MTITTVTIIVGTMIVTVMIAFVMMSVMVSIVVFVAMANANMYTHPSLRHATGKIGRLCNDTWQYEQT